MSFHPHSPKLNNSTWQPCRASSYHGHKTRFFLTAMAEWVFVGEDWICVHLSFMRFPARRSPLKYVSRRSKQYRALGQRHRKCVFPVFNCTSRHECLWREPDSLCNICQGDALPWRKRWSSQWKRRVQLDIFTRGSGYSGRVGTDHLTPPSGCSKHQAAERLWYGGTFSISPINRKRNRAEI